MSSGRHLQRFLRRVFKSRVVLLTPLVLLFLGFRPKINDDQPTLLNRANSQRLLDLHGFQYLINNDLCRNKKIFMIIVVHSSPRHFGLRGAIRQMIHNASAELDQKIRLAFMLAKVNDSNLQRRLHVENVRHGDVIQGNFVDSYHNLTYKHVMGLKWASEHCMKAEYLIKMDDDIFVDLYKLTDLLKSDHFKMDNSSILCNVFDELIPSRTANNKWYVTIEEYPLDIYPKYCSGWIEVMTMEVTKNLVEKAMEMTPFWIDDIFVTGLVASRINVSYVDLDYRVTAYAERAIDWLQKLPFKNYDFSFMVAPIGRSGRLLRDLHDKATWCYKNGCPVLPTVHRIWALSNG